MAEVRVRNLEEWVVEEFRKRAQRHGRSMEAELREVLSTEAASRKKKILEEMRALREETFKKYGLMSDSAELIRQDRDERG